MRFRELLIDVPQARITPNGDPPIGSLVYDSRLVRPGSVFVAMRGFHVDGHEYIERALAAGAAAVVYEDEAVAPLLADVASAQVDNARVALAPIAASFYGHPGRAMRVVGITGTDGKTTTTFLTSAALEAGGHTTGFIGTVDFKIGRHQSANATRQSTPEAPEVQAMLRDMVDAGCDYAVLESTSHALSARWNRLGGCDFDVAVLTNVTTEHLDFHGSVEQYRRDKARLFEMLGEDGGRWMVDGVGVAPESRKLAIVNADDPNHQMFLDAAPAYAERLTYGVVNRADVQAIGVQASRDGLFFRVETPWGERQVRLKLTGDFNVSNALAALAVACAEGVSIDRALQALESISGVRGRMERIEQGQPFTVLVDYAHTPGSFEKLMTMVRPLTNNKLIAVFGSAGERDREKRPMQGEIAGRFCDLLVLTDEDPRLEDRDAIIADIAMGAERSGKREGSGYLRVPDRTQAIRVAFGRAAPGDIVLLLGKGHEASIIYADHKQPWDEAAVARAALAEDGYEMT